MMEVQLIAIFLAYQTITADSSFSFCPNLCTCKNKRIDCPMESLPVKLPPDSFNQLFIEHTKSRAALIPPRAIQLSSKNEQLSVSIFHSNISTISAHAFEGLDVIKSLKINYCRISELEKYSLSNINITSLIFITRTSIGTIHHRAFYKLRTKKIYIFKSNISRITSDAFNRIQIGEALLYNNSIKHVESNAFGLRTAGIDLLKLKYSIIGSFGCNEASNRTSLNISNITVNCSCAAVWILKNMSSFYHARSQFKCREKPGFTLEKMKENLLMSCSNQTEAMKQTCLSMPEVDNVRALGGDATQHLISMSLFLFSWLFLLEMQ